jgi:hypothetical protein
VPAGSALDDSSFPAEAVVSNVIRNEDVQQAMVEIFKLMEMEFTLPCNNLVSNPHPSQFLLEMSDTLLADQVKNSSHPVQVLEGQMVGTTLHIDPQSSQPTDEHVEPTCLASNLGDESLQPTLLQESSALTAPVPTVA